MSTNNVVGINVTSVAKEIEKEKRREETRTSLRARVEPVADEVTIQKDAKTADFAEAERPQRPKSTTHDRLKNSRTDLRNAVRTAKALRGEKGSTREVDKNLEEEVASELQVIEEKIAELQAKEEAAPKIARLQKVREKLLTSLEAYRGAQAEAASPAPAVATASTTGSDVSSQATPEEETLWGDLERKLEPFGIRVTDRVDVERIQERLFEGFRTKMGDLETEKRALEGRRSEIVEQLRRTDLSPAERSRLEADLRGVEAQLQSVVRQISSLRSSFAQANVAAENVLKQQVARELGLRREETTLTPRSATVGTASARENRGQVSGDRGQRSAVGDQPSAPVLGTASAGGSGSTAPTLVIASANDESAGIAPESGSPGGAVPLVAANDYSGTTLSIASTGNQLRSEAKRVDKLVKKLLQAVLSGNFDAITSALIMLDKRARMIVISLGAQTIKSLQNYEKQMSLLSQSLGQLRGNEPDYNARLAKINSEMNLYSLNRQAIANFLRDTMTMNEETASLTSSWIQKVERLNAAALKGF